MEIKIEKQIYLYGVSQNPKNKDDGSNELVIYVSPQIFDKVPLSSLEGYFVSDESRSNEEDCLSSFVPQFSFYRDIMGKMEERFNGQFFPFGKS